MKENSQLEGAYGDLKAANEDFQRDTRYAVKKYLKRIAKVGGLDDDEFIAKMVEMYMVDSAKAMNDLVDDIAEAIKRAKEAHVRYAGG